MKGTVGSVEVVNVSTFKPALDLEGLLRLVVHLEPIITINLSTIQIVPGKSGFLVLADFLNLRN